MRLASLHLYPVKSTRGFAPDSWALDHLGLRHDRRWLIVRPSGEFITQRTEPRLALVESAITDVLALTAPAQPLLELPLASAQDAPRLRVRIWEAAIDALLVSPHADEWLTRYLGYPARLVALPDDAERPVDPQYATAPQDRTAFTDGFPLLLIGQASLDELNGRLAAPVPMNRFRPNLVIEGSEPFAEDGWRRIRIGDVILSIVKPCARCVVTTTDQDTAIVGTEPLRTLSTYRRVDGKVMFGQNVIHAAPGTLARGAPVEVLDA